MRDHLSDDVRRALSDPRSVCDRLRLKVQQRSGSYCLVQCPVHGDRHASCSVHFRNGSVAVKCHGCDFSGDVFTLVAAVYGLDSRRDFKEVLATAAELAGFREQAEVLRSGREAPRPRVLRPSPAPAPVVERGYPPAAEVAELWATAQPIESDADARAMLTSRRIDPMRVMAADLARVLHPDTHRTRLPRWARYRGSQAVSRPWTQTGHRLLLPVYDHVGTMSSLRAWRVGGDDSMPKRIPPSGHKASELVLANSRGVSWLAGDARPSRIICVEGEPDFLARSLTSIGACVIGILSGSWTEKFAKRVPYGCEFIIRTHLDEAGDRYASEITKTIEARAIVRRWHRENPAA